MATINPKNILIAMQLVGDLMAAGQRILDSIKKAQGEGRDINQAEVECARDLAKGSLDSLDEALKEGSES